MRLRADFVVIGSGIAGLRAAIHLVAHGAVVLVTKADSAESNTGYAQGGIAAALGPDDSTDLHRDDTLEAGAGLCDVAAVEVLVSEGPHYVRELLDWGADFDRDADGAPALGREGAHTVRRVLHARDATGREIARTLWQRVAGHPQLRVLDHALATRLDVQDGVCRGVHVRLDDGRQVDIDARAVLLATGGAGQVFQETTNPHVASGDGLAMSWRAGARVSDLEFVQFHPTVLHVPGAARFLVSEAVRGEGARLVNGDGEAFMARYDRRGDLAPRDVVATAMVREAERTGGPVYLTLAHLDAAWATRRFPGIAEACARAGLDFARDRLPVSPAAHYLCGGVDTDLAGRTAIAGLVCGRRGGVHAGARRQSPGQQLAARRAGLRRPCGDHHGRCARGAGDAAGGAGRRTGRRVVRATPEGEQADGARRAGDDVARGGPGPPRRGAGARWSRALGPRAADGSRPGPKTSPPTAAPGDRPTSRAWPGSSRAPPPGAPRAAAGTAARTSRIETM